MHWGVTVLRESNTDNDYSRNTVQVTARGPETLSIGSLSINHWNVAGDWPSREMHAWKSWSILNEVRWDSVFILISGPRFIMIISQINSLFKHHLLQKDRHTIERDKQLFIKSLFEKFSWSYCFWNGALVGLVTIFGKMLKYFQVRLLRQSYVNQSNNWGMKK